MAFKPVTNVAIDIKKGGEVPHVGTYTGNKKIQTQMGEQTVWQFEGEDGMPFGIYGFTMLNRAMENVKEGWLCRITYKGQQEVMTKKFGKKKVHQVLLEVDDAHGNAESNGSSDDADEVSVEE